MSGPAWHLDEDLPALVRAMARADESGVVELLKAAGTAVMLQRAMELLMGVVGERVVTEAMRAAGDDARVGEAVRQLTAAGRSRLDRLELEVAERDVSWSRCLGCRIPVSVESSATAQSEPLTITCQRCGTSTRVRRVTDRRLRWLESEYVDEQTERHAAAWRVSDVALRKMREVHSLDDRDDAIRTVVWTTEAALHAEGEASARVSVRGLTVRVRMPGDGAEAERVRAHVRTPKGDLVAFEASVGPGEMMWTAVDELGREYGLTALPALFAGERAPTGPGGDA